MKIFIAGGMSLFNNIPFEKEMYLKHQYNRLPSFFFIKHYFEKWWVAFINFEKEHK